MGSSRPLFDAPERSYAAKLALFARFAEPELRRALFGLGLRHDARVLDVGCGTAATSRLIAEILGPDGHVVGMDLSRPHLRAAQQHDGVSLVQADASRLCFRERSFDLIWCCNTIHHLSDPVGALSALRVSLREGGRIVLAQSGLLPEMFFAWDAPLDEAVRRACHAYYRERYALSVGDTAAVRGLLSLVQQAGLRQGRVSTLPIERVNPLSRADRDYFAEAVFAGAWGQRILPFLDEDERQRLARNCDPDSPEYCLDRPDFHHLQTLTICVALA
jgi:SAM-dependent methyltransferase